MGIFNIINDNMIVDFFRKIYLKEKAVKYYNCPDKKWTPK